jgi:Protein of unknown function (DUF2723)
MTKHAQHAWHSAGVVGLLLCVVYGSTGASSLTFWDASEFATAIGTLGIPHPPGTPLYVSIGSALWRVLPGLSPVQAGTLLSVLATATAGAAAAWLITRVSGERMLGVVAGVCAGAMGTVWTNATETEVYAVALLSATVQYVVAWRAHVTESDRSRVLVAYLAALSLPLHLSALVASPAALLLACTTPAGTVQWRALLTSAVLLLATVALSAGWPIVAVVLVLATAVSAKTRPAALATLLAWSAVAMLLVRARQSPFLNQGDPDTIRKLLDVLSRAQYDVAAVWPRRAPFWLQLGNIGQYADWQVALSLWNDVTPSWWRTPFTVAAAALGITGALAHWRSHRVTARPAVVLFLLATLGVCVQLNLRAGPSFGVGVLPEFALHEARERDYFFALGFFIWGLWMGGGAWRLVRAARLPQTSALLLPGLLLAGNWSAISRAALPDKRMATGIADALLTDVPPRSLLFTAGDNDSYPLWYRQAVDSVRPDVQVVVTSLLPANWYLRESVWRQSRNVADTTLQPSGMVRAAALARVTLEQRGIVAVSILVPSDDRAELGRLAEITCWRRVGLVDLGSRRAVCPPRIDAERVTEAATRLRSLLSPPARESPDGMVRAFQSVARCPALAATAALTGVASLDSAARRLLDITCNLR